MFSQSLYSLDLIEHFLGKVDEATQEARVDEKLNGHVGKSVFLFYYFYTIYVLHISHFLLCYVSQSRQKEPSVKSFCSPLPV